MPGWSRTICPDEMPRMVITLWPGPRFWMDRPAMFRESPSRLKVLRRWMSASSCTLTEKGTSMTDSVRLVAVTTISSN